MEEKGCVSITPESSNSISVKKKKKSYMIKLHGWLDWKSNETGQTQIFLKVPNISKGDGTLRQESGSPGWAVLMEGLGEDNMPLDKADSDRSSLWSLSTSCPNNFESLLCGQMWGSPSSECWFLSKSFINIAFSIPLQKGKPQWAQLRQKYKDTNIPSLRNDTV